MCFNFLLLYSVSRSYLILRPRNKSDPDPKLLTVLLRIWPWMFLVTPCYKQFLPGLEEPEKSADAEKSEILR